MDGFLRQYFWAFSSISKNLAQRTEKCKKPFISLIFQKLSKLHSNSILHKTASPLLVFEKCLDATKTDCPFPRSWSRFWFHSVALLYLHSNTILLVGILKRSLVWLKKVIFRPVGKTPTTFWKTIARLYVLWWGLVSILLRITLKESYTAWLQFSVYGWWLLSVLSCWVLVSTILFSGPVYQVVLEIGSI